LTLKLSKPKTLTESRDTELTRIWAAKEAMYKAHKGAIEASSFELAQDEAGKELLLMTGGTGGGKFKTYASTLDNLVLAYTICETV